MVVFIPSCLTSCWCRSCFRFLVCGWVQRRLYFPKIPPKAIEILADRRAGGKVRAQVQGKPERAEKRFTSESRREKPHLSFRRRLALQFLSPTFHTPLYDCAVQPRGPSRSTGTHGDSTRSRRRRRRRSFLRTAMTSNPPNTLAPLRSPFPPGTRRAGRPTTIPRRHQRARPGILQGRFRKADESKGGGVDFGDIVSISLSLGRAAQKWRC